MPDLIGARSHPLPILRGRRTFEDRFRLTRFRMSRATWSKMKVVSGPPLLHQAAVEALKKWKYVPTYLNDQAIVVQMIVTITFALGQ